MREGGGWATRLGFILAAVGSAIGLGNIWRFPYQVSENGGGAFLLPYFGALVLAGIPVLIVELWLGSETRLTTPLALREKFRESEFLGWWAVLNGFIVNAYYVVILGWALGFVWFALTNAWAGETLSDFFAAYLQSWWPAIGVLIVWGVNYVVLVLGVEKGLERANKLIVPLIWVFVIVLAIRGITLPGGMEGLNNYLEPDTAALADPGIWISAFGQIYFTLSVALGIMTTYASYQPEGEDITNNAMIIALANTGFAFLAGFAIFPYVTATGVEIDQSIGLAFIVLPKAFAQLPLTQVFGAVFFGLLTLAGLSSSLSLAEGQVGPLREKLAMERTTAVTAIVLPGLALSLLIGAEGALTALLAPSGPIGSVLQEGLGVTLGGVFEPGDSYAASLSLLSSFDTASATYTLPLIALGETLLFGWVYGADRIATAVNEVSDVHLPPIVLQVSLQIVVPAVLAYSILSKIAGGQSGLIAPFVIVISLVIASYTRRRSEAVSGGDVQ